VTDPLADAFKHAEKYWTSQTRWKPTLIGWQRASPDGASVVGGSIFTGKIAMELLVAQFIAASIVAPCCALSRRRARMRIRLRRCVACGHQLGPGESIRPCPECGYEAPRTTPTYRRSVFGGAFVAAMLTFVAAGVTVMLATASHRTSEDMREQNEQRLALEQAEIDAANTTHLSWQPVAMSEYGLFQTVIWKRVGTYFLLTPNGSPRRILDPMHSPGLRVDWSERSIDLSNVNATSLESVRYSFEWSIASVHLAGMELAAVLASTLICGTMGAIRCMRRSRLKRRGSKDAPRDE